MPDNYRRPKVGERIITGDIKKNGYTEVTVTQLSYDVEGRVHYIEVEYDTFFGKKRKWISILGAYSVGFKEKEKEQNV